VTDGSHVAATRNGYDAIAEQYAEFFRAELDDAPLDRALLRAFAEMVRRDHPDARVLEAGSGPGTVTAHLHQLELDVRGIDLSPAMVDIARRHHPQISFDVGDMGALACADAGLAGLVAWSPGTHSSTCPLPSGRESSTSSTGCSGRAATH
jgi:SAM-dependent methyltransferase